MAEDARFESAGDQALRLAAETEADLKILSALLQDAVGKVGRVHWTPRRRRFSLLLYRFRWEDADRAEKERRVFERVAAALTIDDVMAVRATGIDHGDKEAVFNLLSLNFDADEDGAGVIRLACSEGREFALEVECLNAALVDLTRPWAASGKPAHDAD